MGNGSSEHRIARRYIAEFPIRFRQEGYNQNWQEAFVEDFSESGLEINIPLTLAPIGADPTKQLSKNQPINLEFAVSSTANPITLFRLSGKVVWEKKNQRLEEIGVQF